MSESPAVDDRATLRWTAVPTPLGDLRLVAAHDSLAAVLFDGAAACGPGERPTRRAARSGAAETGERADDDPLLSEAARQFTAYFAGSLTTFDLPLAPRGTPFQQRVWARLREIPYGAVTTYGELAAGLGMTGHAARAVGAANGANPIAIAIPCHRVVGAGGKLIGYAAGLSRKQRLLALEQHTLF